MLNDFCIDFFISAIQDVSNFHVFFGFFGFLTRYSKLGMMVFCCCRKGMYHMKKEVPYGMYKMTMENVRIGVRQCPYDDGIWDAVHCMAKQIIIVYRHMICHAIPVRREEEEVICQE